MEKLHYKVMKTGHIKGFVGKTQVSRLAEEIPMGISERHRLRGTVDPKLAVAAKLVFGRKYVPADINEMADHKALIYQVLKDSPQALLLAYTLATGSGRLTAKPFNSVVRRMKDVFMRKGYVPPQRGASGGLRPGRTQAGLIRKETDVNKFWDHYADKPALTEAGWRYLLRLPFETKTELCVSPWYFYRHMDVLNTLAELQFPALTVFHYKVARFGLDALTLEPSQRNYLLALRNAIESGHQVDAAEEDYLSDLLQESPNLVVQPGTAWATLVDDAAQFLAVKAELNREELSGMKWLAPFDEFTTRGLVKATPLQTGVELLEEGIEMKNCLRKLTNYAARAMKGESLVIALRGAYEGTAEFTKPPRGDWSIQQVAVKCNRKVFDGPLWTAAEEVLQKLHKDAS